jgi:hypothetical protein
MTKIGAGFASIEMTAMEDVCALLAMTKIEACLRIARGNYSSVSCFDSQGCKRETMSRL